MQTADNTITQLEQLKQRALDVLDQDPEIQHAVVVSFLGAMKGAARFQPEAMEAAAKVLGMALEDFENNLQ